MKNLTPDELYKIIGQNVAKYRKEKGLSQLDLSLAMGYKSVSVVSGVTNTLKNDILCSYIW